MIENVKTGVTYKIDHRRKGKFQVNITKITDEWYEGKMVDGVAASLTHEGVHFPGDNIRIRKALCDVYSLDEDIEEGK